MSVGVITIDGTKIKANASMDQNRSYRELVGQILREAEEIDRREDELYGDARGDELPEQLRTPEGRKAALADAKRRIELSARAARSARKRPVAEVVVDPELVLGRGGRRGGRREWPRVARRELEDQREQRSGGRSRAIARTACSRRSVGWRRTTGSTWLPTRPTSTGGRRPGTRRGAC